MAPEPRSFHARIPGYRPTPLLPLDAVASEFGLGSVWMKYEHDRFGLPAFKALGALWAVYRWLDQRIPGGLDARWTSFEDLRALTPEAGPLTLVAATDGNHGRAVARVAALFGFQAHILVPAGTAASRMAAIAAEGARVEEVDAEYDAVVRRAAALADSTHLVVSDTSWDGYVDIPRFVAEGYATLFAEIDDVLLDRSAPRPDMVVVPVGVGALAQAAITHYGAAGTAVVSVEPSDAACVLASLRADERTTVRGPHRSMMAGLNCGTPSKVAWPAMRDGLAAALAIDDDHAVRAMRMLADQGIEVGETGAASLAGLIALAGRELRPLREALPWSPTSSVVLLATEGITDPLNYARMVAR
ncbi:diaminopropionate ammonia-lyase [Streptomyces oryzae]|uniref:Diaminopropionate ammonia-lyase n=2 Tax=Streptomyces oryzae TaxID=1434886 RepID=A0ABS3XAR2_9ACTN|nr:diaminopropionate ammonia-lyase [Streptomyces oryzae]